MIRDFAHTDVVFILHAAIWTIALSALAFLAGGVGGLLVALTRTSGSRLLRLPATVFIVVFQGTPLLMQLFLIFFGSPFLGYDINAWTAALLGLTLHASAFLGEIWRGCIEAVPGGQVEAAKALGLRYFDRMRDVIIPHAARLAMAPTVGFLVQLVKGTSLVAIIGFVELTRAGQIVNNATFQPFTVFGIVAAIYFAICWPLSLINRRMEAKNVAKA